MNPVTSSLSLFVFRDAIASLDNTIYKKIARRKYLDDCEERRRNARQRLQFPS